MSKTHVPDRHRAASTLKPLATLDEAVLFEKLASSPAGLAPAIAQSRLLSHGPNRITQERRLSIVLELIRRIGTPLNALLLALAITSWILSDYRSAVVIVIMVMLSVGMGFVQEHRSSLAAARLKRMVQVHATAKRPGADRADQEGFVDVPLEAIVPGDIVRLAAGDLIPADLRLLSATDFHVNQSPLTGESMPVDKQAIRLRDTDSSFDLPNLCFMGSSVVSGFATGVILRTGRATYFGEIADEIVGTETVTNFDKGLNQFVWMMLRFMFVLVPLVFLINGLTKHDWLEALLFAVAVAVGLAPEMLPMVVTMNLARGAIAMSRQRVIVKRLNAIQNFGAMDVLCTDKTGTLTQDRVILKLHLDVEGNDSEQVLAYAYLNSRFESGLKNVMDKTILQHVEMEDHPIVAGDYDKLGELPFDFSRRRVSVALRRPRQAPLLICKGAVEEVLQVCTRFQLNSDVRLLEGEPAKAIHEVANGLNRDGFRVLAIASRQFDSDRSTVTRADERDLTLIGFAAFLDPPKETAGPAIHELQRAGIAVKILTGDNDLVTRKICRDVGLCVDQLMLGSEIDLLDDAGLAARAEAAQAFAKVSPAQKARVIAALQANGHAVGFLGDGINDSPALKAADVGISVDTAVDIAKESADIILLEKSLQVLGAGVIEGRRVFVNIIKYIRMGASSNFGNMFSVLGASIMLPFLPMAPLQA